MKKSISIVIKDLDCFVWKLPHFIRKLFIKTYYNQGFIYVKFDTVKWLDNLEILTYSEKRAHKLSFDYLNEKYPQYRGFINLF